MEKRTADQESEAKRTKTEHPIYDLLNKDLREWKLKLKSLKRSFEPNSPEDKWQLVFFSGDRNSESSDPFYSFPDAIPGKWKFEEYEQTFQNMGGAHIAFAICQESLTPASILAEKRLQLFGFVYVICPVGLKLPKTRAELFEKFGNVTYGNLECRFTAKRLYLGESLPIPESYASAGDGDIDIDNPDYIDAIYAEHGPRGQDEIIDWYCYETREIHEVEKTISELEIKYTQLIQLYETRREIFDTFSRPGSTPYASTRKYERGRIGAWSTSGKFKGESDSSEL